MPAEAPAFRPAFVMHAHRAEADIIHTRDIPAAMMKARRGGFHQGQKVMVAAVDSVHEGNEVGGTIGKPKTKRTLVELDRLGNVTGKDQDVREPARTHRGSFLSRGCAGGSCEDGDPLAVRFPVGRHLAPDFHFDQHAFMVAEPETIAFEARRRVDKLDALLFDARFQARKVVGIATK
jgi:hypothetical protein